MQERENAICVKERKAYSFEVRWPAIPSPLLGCAGSSQHPPGPRRQPESPRPPSAPGPPRGRAAPGPWEKSFQKALLGADWPRRTRSRGAAANERRGPGAQGRGGGPRSEPHRPQSPPPGPSPPVFVARSRVSAELQPPAGWLPARDCHGREETAVPRLAPAALSGRPAAGVQGPCVSDVRLRVASRPPGLGRWSRNSRFPGASLPNFVPSHPVRPHQAPRPCQLSFACCPPHPP